MTIFSASETSISSSCQDANVHMYATTYELKKKAFTTNSQNLKQAIGMQMILIFQVKFQKKIFQQNITISSASYVFILNPCQDGNVDPYTTTQELKKNAFKLNSEIIKQIIGTQLTFILEIKLQKELLLEKYNFFFCNGFLHFGRLLGCECAFVFLKN